jgi:hypothetical protein
LFEKACEWDELIRSTGTMKGMRSQQFVSKLLVPLRELPSVEELEKHPLDQIDMFADGCEEGMCGV